MRPRKEATGSRPPAPERLRSLRRRVQPAAVTVVRLTVPATLAYLTALPIIGDGAPPLLAPLTALLVVQVTWYQTLRSACQRVVSVVAGVVVAVGFAVCAGFSWWSLAVTIAAALVIGQALRLGDHSLEVPISAMLVLSLHVPDAVSTAAWTRVAETLIGAGVGLLARLAASPVRIRPAGEAAEELAREMAGLLRAMAGELRDQPRPPVERWLERAQRLRREILRVERALDEAEESLRLNPRAAGLVTAAVALRGGLENQEHATFAVRGLARGLADQARRRDERAPLYGEEVRRTLAEALRELASATHAYGVALRSGGGDEGLARALRDHVNAARAARDRLSGLLPADPASGPADWPLHGELLVHLTRLCDLLPPVERACPARSRVRPRIRRAPRALARSLREAPRRPGRARRLRRHAPALRVPAPAGHGRHAS